MYEQLIMIDISYQLLQKAKPNTNLIYCVCEDQLAINHTSLFIG